MTLNNQLIPEVENEGLCSPLKPQHVLPSQHHISDIAVQELCSKVHDST